MNQEQFKLLPLEVKRSPKGTVFNNTIIKDGGALPLLAMIPAITAGIGRASEISALSQGNPAKVNPTLADKALANYSGEALPMAALAPLIIGLLLSVIEAALSVIEGIKKIISGEGYSQAELELLASEAAQPRAGAPCCSLVQPKTREALPMAALAPIIISLLPTIIEKDPDAIDGIKRVLSGSGINVLEDLHSGEALPLAALAPNII